MEGKDAEKHLLPADKVEGKPPDTLADWKTHEDFIGKWRAMEPLFGDAEALAGAAISYRAGFGRSIISLAAAQRDLAGSAC